jgi:HEAT repeat protein
VSKMDEYRETLRKLNDWDSYLLKESGLPGPRGNLELAQVVADEGDPELFRRYTAYTADQAPVNSPYEFIAFCGVVGLGRLLAEGDIGLLEPLRIHASDPRWRIREAVAMALQRLGDINMDQLIAAMQNWSKGTPLEQRAAAAALCEPRLLGQAKHARAVLRILDEITATFEQVKNRRSEDFLALRKGLGYCWSVAVVALPNEGKLLMEKWLVTTDKDVQWVMRENIKKARLARMDSEWVKKWRNRVDR